MAGTEKVRTLYHELEAALTPKLAFIKKVSTSKRVDATCDELTALLWATTPQMTSEFDRLDTVLAAPSGSVIDVHAGASLQAAIDAAPDGATVRLEPAIYPGPIRLAKRLTLVAGGTLTPGRATRDGFGVWIVGSGPDAITVTGPDVQLTGIGGKNTNPDGQIVNLTGPRTILDRVVLVGDPVKGQHRGVALNNDGGQVLRSFIDDCTGVGRDCQAIMAWDGAANGIIDDCYLAGSGQSVMFGGADQAAADRMPRRMTLRNSLLTKKPSWYAENKQVKCALEFKAIAGCTCQNLTLEYAGIAEGQGGYLIVATPRNQDGGSPWSAVTDVTLDGITGRMAGGVLNVLGTDNVHPSGFLDRFSLTNATFSQIDPMGIWKGHGRVFQFMAGPRNVRLEHVTVTGANLAAAGYFIEPKPVGLVLKHVQVPSSAYSFKIDGGGMGLAALQAWIPDAVLENVTEG